MIDSVLSNSIGLCFEHLFNIKASTLSIKKMCYKLHKFIPLIATNLTICTIKPFVSLGAYYHVRWVGEALTKQHC